MKSFTGKSLIAVGVAGLAICLFTFSALPTYGLDKKPLPLGSIQSVTTPLVTSNRTRNEMEQLESGLPVRLRIPSIRINSAIEYVGLTSTGAMNVPKVTGNVGWFSLGPRPGEFGSAVIAGHYSRRGSGAGGVFRELSKLRKGDMIYVVDGNGITVTFVVRENRLFDFDANASEVFTSDNGTYLNLITCAGSWDSSEQSSTKRRVIFAEIIQRTPAGTAT